MWSEIKKYLRNDWDENGPSGCIGVILGAPFIVAFVIFFWVDGLHNPASPSNIKLPAGDALKAMPLTIESSQKFLAIPLESLTAITREQMFPENDLTKPLPSVEPMKVDSRFKEASEDQRIIQKMGYDYNLTVRDVARNRKILESRPAFTAPLCGIGEHAAKYRDILLQEKLIDRETFEALNAAYPRDVR